MLQWHHVLWSLLSVFTYAMLIDVRTQRTNTWHYMQIISKKQHHLSSQLRSLPWSWHSWHLVSIITKRLASLIETDDNMKSKLSQFSLTVMYARIATLESTSNSSTFSWLFPVAHSSYVHQPHSINSTKHVISNLCVWHKYWHSAAF